MTVTLSDIRFDCEQVLPDNALNNEKVIKWCNMATSDFMLQIFIPGSTTLAVNTTSLMYTLSPTTIREIRRIRLQTDITNLVNRPYNPVYTFYNGVFEIAAPFQAVDTLLIDYYKYLTTFTAVTDNIDIEDRFKPLYTSYIEAQWYLLPDAVKLVGDLQAQRKYDIAMGIYNRMRKQVTDFYTVFIGIQKPLTSGW